MVIAVSIFQSHLGGREPPSADSPAEPPLALHFSAMPREPGSGHERNGILDPLTMCLIASPSKCTESFANTNAVIPPPFLCASFLLPSREKRSRWLTRCSVNLRSSPWRNPRYLGGDESSSPTSLAGNRPKFTIRRMALWSLRSQPRLKSHGRTRTATGRTEQTGTGIFISESRRRSRKRLPRHVRDAAGRRVHARV